MYAGKPFTMRMTADDKMSTAGEDLAVSQYEDLEVTRWL